MAILRRAGQLEASELLRSYGDDIPFPLQITGGSPQILVLSTKENRTLYYTTLLLDYSPLGIRPDLTVGVAMNLQ